MAQKKANNYPGALGQTIQRLRKAYKMSLGDLSEQSGVAKSIISQIERNESNPTIGTVWRLSKALDSSIDEVLKSDDGANFLEHQKGSAIPMLISQDAKCSLAIIGSLQVVDWLQWYDFKAEPGGELVSDPHRPGTMEHLSVLEGALEVTVGEDSKTVIKGETIRYRGDQPHKIVNTGDVSAHATMVNVLKLTVVD